MGPLMQGNALLALLSAALWGCGDFCGGMGVKRIGGTLVGALRLILLSHISSFVVLAAIALTDGMPFPHGAPLAWALGAGLAGGASLTCFYIALSRGAMGASAAVSGLLAAAIPAGVSMVAEGSPGMLRLAGFMVAGVAIWMIAAGPVDVAVAASTLWLSVAAGVGFGIYFVSLKYAGPAGAVWAMGAARLGSITLCGVTLLAMMAVRKGVSAGTGFGWKAAGWAWGTALFDTSGNLLFVLATRAGRLDVAAVLASLYPATTILLAAWTLGERPTPRQAWGMAVAAVAVVMISVRLGVRA